MKKKLLIAALPALALSIFSQIIAQHPPGKDKFGNIWEVPILRSNGIFIQNGVDRLGLPKINTGKWHPTNEPIPIIIPDIFDENGDIIFPSSPPPKGYDSWGNYFDSLKKDRELRNEIRDRLAIPEPTLKQPSKLDKRDPEPLVPDVRPLPSDFVPPVTTPPVEGPVTSTPPASTNNSVTSHGDAEPIAEGSGQNNSKEDDLIAEQLAEEGIANAEANANAGGYISWGSDGQIIVHDTFGSSSGNSTGSNFGAGGSDSDPTGDNVDQDYGAGNGTETYDIVSIAQLNDPGATPTLDTLQPNQLETGTTGGGNPVETPGGEITDVGQPSGTPGNTPTDPTEDEDNSTTEGQTIIEEETTEGKTLGNRFLRSNHKALQRESKAAKGKSKFRRAATRRRASKGSTRRARSARNLEIRTQKQFRTSRSRHSIRR